MRKIPNILRRIKYRLFPPPKISSYLEIESVERIFYLEYLREGMTVFDVGANIGELTLIFSRFVNNGKVHAFEASKAAFRKLETICRTAKRRNTILNYLALADKKGSIHLYIYDDNYLAFNTQAVREIEEYGLPVEPVGIEEVSATTIDDYCEENGIEQIDLLKIDVEGSELQVMKGAEKMLQSKRIKCMTFEFGQTTLDMGIKPEEIKDYLKKMNYSIHNIMKDEPLFPIQNGVALYSMHVSKPI